MTNLDVHCVLGKLSLGDGVVHVPDGEVRILEIGRLIANVINNSMDILQ